MHIHRIVRHFEHAVDLPPGSTNLSCRSGTPALPPSPKTADWHLTCVQHARATPHAHRGAPHARSAGRLLLVASTQSTWVATLCEGRPASQMEAAAGVGRPASETKGGLQSVAGEGRSRCVVAPPYWPCWSTRSGSHPRSLSALARGGSACPTMGWSPTRAGAGAAADREATQRSRLV